MTEDKLTVLLKQAMDARRREDWAAARAEFTQLRHQAEAAGDTEHSTIAEAHLAILQGNREAAQAALDGLVALNPAAGQAAAIGMLMARSFPAPPRHSDTHLVARAGTFRRLCATLPRPAEVALELGCAHGLATRVLSEHCETVYAVDKTAFMVEATRGATAHLANVRVIRADVDQPGCVRAQVPAADLLFLDIGGSSPAAKVLHCAHVYRELYQPRIVVMRCVYLNNLVAELASCEPRHGPSIWKRPDAS